MSAYPGDTTATVTWRSSTTSSSLTTRVALYLSSSSPSDTDILAGSGIGYHAHADVTTIGASSSPEFTGLTPTSAYTAYIIATDGNSRQSTTYTIDIDLPPQITSVLVTEGETGASFTWTSADDRGTIGTRYWGIYAAGSSPTSAEVKIGSGAIATKYGQADRDSVPLIGGLTAGTTYVFAVTCETVAGQLGSVTLQPFTTDAASAVEATFDTVLPQNETATTFAGYFTLTLGSDPTPDVYMGVWLNAASGGPTVITQAMLLDPTSGDDPVVPGTDVVLIDPDSTGETYTFTGLSPLTGYEWALMTKGQGSVYSSVFTQPVTTTPAASSTPDPPTLAAAPGGTLITSASKHAGSSDWGPQKAFDGIVDSSWISSGNIFFTDSAQSNQWLQAVYPTSSTVSYAVVYFSGGTSPFGAPNKVSIDNGSGTTLMTERILNHSDFEDTTLTDVNFGAFITYIVFPFDQAYTGTTFRLVFGSADEPGSDIDARNGIAIRNVQFF